MIISRIFEKNSQLWARVGNTFITLCVCADVDAENLIKFCKTPDETGGRSRAAKFIIFLLLALSAE
jgi:hypothetical protein